MVRFSHRAGSGIAGGIFLTMGAVAMILSAAGCRSSRDSDSAEGRREVVVYAALDQMFSEPLLKQFERETGIRVRAVYDAEAVKTVGLVNRIISEQSNPRCDVFWNNEILRTLLLKRKGLTQPYVSPEAAAFPESMRDPEGHWTGFAARARVIIYNKNLVAEADRPEKIEDMLDARWRGRSTIAKPLFGTTATHAAMLWALWGPERTQTFFNGLRANGVVVAAGNATTRDQVVLGEIPWGLTDSDDASVAMLDGKPVGVAFIEHEDPAGARGIVLIPNSVCLIRNAPNPEAGRRLIDYILSAEVETALSRGPSAQLPLRPGITPPPGWEEMARRKPLSVQWEEVLDALDPSAKWLDENFVR